jgi:hypothetical protein
MRLQGYLAALPTLSPAGNPAKCSGRVPAFIALVVAAGDGLALQLPFFEMSSLRGGLVDSAPE